MCFQLCLKVSELLTTGSISVFKRKTRPEPGFLTYVLNKKNKSVHHLAFVNLFLYKIKKGTNGAITSGEKKKAFNCFRKWEMKVTTDSISTQRLQLQSYCDREVNTGVRPCLCIQAADPRSAPWMGGAGGCWERINWRQVSENADYSHLMELNGTTDSKRKTSYREKNS